MSTPVRIPLHRRGAGVIGFALVDAEDALRLAGFKWKKNNNGYAVRHAPVDGVHRAILMAREICGLTFGDPRVTDHINRDKLDNRRENLRVASSAENAQNVGITARSTSRFRGVHAWNSADRLGRCWRAYGHSAGRTRHLGLFADELEAALAAQAWRDEHMPFAQPDLALVDALAALAMKDVAA